MFYSIKGILIHKDEDSAVIETQGVAYEMLIPSSVSDDLPAPGQEAQLFTKLIVRENEQFLIGFSSTTDKRLYESLITVSGIGPKHGLKMLSQLSAGEIRSAIINNDATALSRVKGIGPRSASRIILELQDKMAKFVPSELPSSSSATDKKRIEALMALRVLGYNDLDSKKTLDIIAKDFSELMQEEVEVVIKKALALMSRS